MKLDSSDFHSDKMGFICRMSTFFKKRLVTNFWLVSFDIFLSCWLVFIFSDANTFFPKSFDRISLAFCSLTRIFQNWGSRLYQVIPKSDGRERIYEGRSILGKAWVSSCWEHLGSAYIHLRRRKTAYILVGIWTVWHVRPLPLLGWREIKCAFIFQWNARY